MALRLKLDAVQDGMILEREVKDRNGRVLLDAGQQVTQKHLRVFKAWGITELVVKDTLSQSKASENPMTTEPQGAVSQIEKEVREFFRHTDLRHPAIWELFQICLKRRMDESSSTKPGVK